MKSKAGKTFLELTKVNVLNNIIYLDFVLVYFTYMLWNESNQKQAQLNLLQYPPGQGKSIIIMALALIEPNSTLVITLNTMLSTQL